MPAINVLGQEIKPGEVPEESHDLAQVRELEGDRGHLSPNDQELVPVIPELATLLYGPAVTLNVSVLHASLEHASYPLAIGHYDGDMILGAEAVLDGRLNKRLSQLRFMDLYPGKAGTVEVVLNPQRQAAGEVKGALVIGLGEVGQITPDIVTRGVTEAALRLALARLGDPIASPAKKPLSAAFSALLIGTRGGRALSIESAVAATVTGALLANRALANRNLLDKVCVDKVEFVEIYGDLATRAAHAVTEVTQNLRITPTVSEKIESEPYLKQGEGGYAAQMSNEYDAAWWQRIQIKETPDPRSDRGSGELQFLLLTDRARAELTLQATQRALVERLVEKTIHEPSADPDLSATLYDLLLPNELKEQRLESTNLLLVVDHKAAQYPWEMLAERQPGGGESREPLAVRNGMVRQLETGRYRVQVQAPHSMNALVIGEPLLDDPAYPPLPGASAEAEAVAKVLEDARYNVTTCFQEDALTIIKALFAKEYRIIHIAGHGIYRPDCPAQSGVVLGKDIYLTAAEIGQLRVVPEMVFLNCCYLGIIDAAAAPSSSPPDQPAWNKLAASVSEKLIDIGVRAVVAAGWAVNDRAAKKFAETLYREMTRNAAQFGDAIHTARKAIYDGGRKTNTWGAYQCYGDPGFLLKVGASTTQPPARRYVAPQEFILDLKNLQSRVSRVTDKGWITRYKNDLRDLETRLSEELPPRWRNGEILTELGDTYAELGDFEEAILRYQEALLASSPQERVPIRTVEQLANLEARFAMQLSLQDKDGKPRAATNRWTIDTLMAKAHERLDLLLKLAPTAERYALLGSYYKRDAVIRRDNSVERNKALKKADIAYGEALKQLKVADKPYHTLNRLACRYLRDMRFTKKERTAAAADLRMIEEEAEGSRETRLSFWERIVRPDAALGRALVGLAQGELEKEEPALLALYQREFELGATARQRSSVLEQLDVVAAILRAKGRVEAAAVVDRLRESLAR